MFAFSAWPKKMTASTGAPTGAWTLAGRVSFCSTARARTPGDSRKRVPGRAAAYVIASAT
jgi:hypothetical protein